MRGGRFSDPRERWLYEVVLAGFILTAVGSAYYHLAPDNHRLVWDRIPIMGVFMRLLAAVIAERVGIGLGLALFPVLEAAGVELSSVLTARNLLILGRGTRAKKATVPNPLKFIERKCFRSGSC